MQQSNNQQNETNPTGGRDLGQIRIETLDLPVRASNFCRMEGIETVDQLVNMTERDLMRLPNVGRLTVKQIRFALRDHGLTLRGDPPIPTMPQQDAGTVISWLRSENGFIVNDGTGRSWIGASLAEALTAYANSQE